MELTLSLALWAIGLAHFIFFLWFYFFRSSVGRKRPVIYLPAGTSRVSARASLVYTVAIMTLDDSERTREIVEGIVETLTRESRVKVEASVVRAGRTAALYSERFAHVVKRKFDLVITFGADLTEYVRRALERDGLFIPVVFVDTGDPVETRLMDSKQYSGNHLTGVAFSGTEWVDWMCADLRILFPQLKRIVIPYCPATIDAATGAALERCKYLAGGRKIVVDEVLINKHRDLTNDLPYYCSEPDSLLLIFPDGTVEQEIPFLATIAERYQLPLMTALLPDSVKRGASLAFMYWPYDLGAAVAKQVLRILDYGRVPGMIPLDDMRGIIRYIYVERPAESQGVLRVASRPGLFLLKKGYLVSENAATTSRSERGALPVGHEGRTVREHESIIRIAHCTSLKGEAMLSYTEGLIATFMQEGRREYEVTMFNAELDQERLEHDVRTILEQRFDLIVATGSAAAQQVHAATLLSRSEVRVPVVFACTGDPERLGLVSPEGIRDQHITGVAQGGMAWIANMIELIPLAVPAVRTVCIPFDPAQLGGLLREYHLVFVTLLEQRGYEVLSRELASASHLSEALTPGLLREIDLIIILPDATIMSCIEDLVVLAEQYRVPTFAAMNPSLLEKGVTMAYGYHLADIGHAAARQIMMIIENQVVPGDIPVDPLDDALCFTVNKSAVLRGSFQSVLDADVLFMLESSRVV